MRRALFQTAIKFAVFALFCGFLTWVLASRIGNLKLFEDKYSLTATFDDVTGLLPNDNVKVAGVPVGKVSKIKIDKGRALVTFSVRDDVKIPTDSKAAVRWRNLLGQRYVYLYPGEASTTYEGGGRIPVEQTVSVIDLGELFNRLGPIVKAIDPEKVNQFLTAITEALGGNEPRLKQAIADLGDLTEALAARDEAIGRLIANLNTVTGALNSRDAQIRTVLDNLVTITTTFNENTEVLERAITHLGAFSRDLGSILKDNKAELDRTVDGLTTIVDAVRRQLPTIDHAIAGLDEAAKRLFTASRYGEWLNQTIPCGRIGYPASQAIQVNDCITGEGGIQNPGGEAAPATASSAAAAAAGGNPIRGLDDLARLLGVPR